MKKNTKFLSILASILIVGYALVGTALYEYTHQYAEDQNKKKLDQILLSQRALHSYLEDTLKPVIYHLKEEEKLYNGFFDPKVLSFTYIARGIHERLNQLRDESNTSRIYYKLASDNPRNPINQADEDELRLLNLLRTKPDLSEYSKIYTENGHHYIFYAMPVERNKESCMKCHSTPDKAPAELIQRYGDTAGFGEKVGNLRAIISLKMPFDDELAEANKIFVLIMSMLAFFLILLFGVISYFFRKLEESRLIIEEKNKDLAILAEQDGLTGIFNRRSFENDLERRIVEDTLTLIIFDIDYFKAINDEYGHQSGDQVLQRLASTVRSKLRETDYFYRIGGEEFAVLTQTNRREEIEILLNRLQNTVADIDFGIGRAVYISIGASHKQAGETSTLLFKRVDNALYKAKENGQNCFVIE